MNDAPLFSSRLLAALGGLVIVLFAVSLLLTGGGGKTEGDNWGANSWSRSALGGLGLYETLEATGRPVARTLDPVSSLGDDSVLVLDEPTQTADLGARLRAAKRVLLILPKRAGEPDPDHEGWIDKSALFLTEYVEAALFPLDSTSKVARAPPPVGFAIDGLAIAPTLIDPAQFIHSTSLRPIVAEGDNILVGEADDHGRQVIVLADPDPLENHGIGKPGNADFAIALFDRIGGGTTKFVFDETIHGFTTDGSTPGRASPALRMLSFPGNLIFALAAMGALLLIAASVGRFGSPLPTPRAFSSGKRALVTNIAALIDFGGHHDMTLRRYVETIFADGAALLRPPPKLRAAERAEWIDRAGAARGARRPASEILAVARRAPSRDLGTLLTAAYAIYLWRREIGHGTG